MRGSGLYSIRVSGLGAMFPAPSIGLSPNVKQMQQMVNASAPMQASRTIAQAPMQYVAPLAPQTAGMAMGVRGDGTVGAVAVRASTGFVGRAPRSVIPVPQSTSLIGSDPALPQTHFTPDGIQRADVSHPAALADQTTDAQDGAQYPAVESLPAADQVHGTSGTTDDTHPATTTSGHWLGGFAVAAGLVVLAVGGVALFRAVA